jgi:hemolysin III
MAKPDIAVERDGEGDERDDDSGDEILGLTKPQLRGMLHLVAFPLSIVSGIVVTILAEGTTATIGSAIYALSGVILFGVSALYHRGHWDARRHALLRRLDHSNIFLLIAGTYTPICLMLLDGTTRTVVLAAVWIGALAGVVFRVAWLGAPRWLYTPFYLGLGWVAIGVMPELGRNGGGGVVALLAVGGLAYTVGGVVYGLRRPDPVPSVYGYHEVFHTCTLVGFGCHYAAVVVAVT